MNVVRYYKADNGEDRRIVEHRDKKKVSTGSGRFDYEYRTKRRWPTLERFDGSGWVELGELGDYVEPKDSPDE